MDKRTVHDLLKALAPKGEVYAYVPLTLIAYGGGQYNRVAHRLRLHKTELIEELRKMKMDQEVADFHVSEWNCSRSETVKGFYRCRARAIYLNCSDPDNYGPRLPLGWIAKSED